MQIRRERFTPACQRNIRFSSARRYIEEIYCNTCNVGNVASWHEIQKLPPSQKLCFSLRCTHITSRYTRHIDYSRRAYNRIVRVQQHTCHTALWFISELFIGRAFNSLADYTRHQTRSCQLSFKCRDIVQVLLREFRCMYDEMITYAFWIQAFRWP